MNFLSSPRFLTIYSGILTVVFAVTVLGGFTQRQPTQFGEINVERINVREPDGTLRLVVSNQAKLPGLYVKEKEYEHKRDVAGLIFYNDEGTEAGGLIVAGKRDAEGNVSQVLHLSFDKYLQDQTLTLQAAQEDGGEVRGLTLIDRPDWPITDLIKAGEGKSGSAMQKAYTAFSETHKQPQERLFLGKQPDKTVGLKLYDPQGRPRLVLQVTKAGQPVLQFLDAKGKVVRQLPD